MKRILICLTVTIIAISLAACSSGNTEKGKVAEQSSTVETTGYNTDITVATIDASDDRNKTTSKEKTGNQTTDNNGEETSRGVSDQTSETSRTTAKHSSSTSTTSKNTTSKKVTTKKNNTTKPYINGQSLPEMPIE